MQLWVRDTCTMRHRHQCRRNQGQHDASPCVQVLEVEAAGIYPATIETAR
jgi:hypothetical protein